MSDARLSVDHPDGYQSSHTRSALVPLFGLFVLGWGTNQFAPLLLFYPQITSVSDVEIQGLFVVYGLSLIPMLLVGGWLSDKIGRRRIFTLAVVIAGVSSLTLLCGGLNPAVIFIGRVLIGVSCGVGFSSGTAWVTELLVAPKGSRLALVFMTGGMGVGSLFVGIFASALLGYSIPNVHIWVMLPHVLLTLSVFLMLSRRALSQNVRAKNLLATKTLRRLHLSGAQQGLTDPRFVRYILPLAPWTLFCTAVPLAVLPSNVSGNLVQDPLLLSAFLTPLPALGGILVQPFGGRAKVNPLFLAPLALLIAIVSVSTSIMSIHWQSVPVLFLTCLIFGVAHGLCQITGLRIITELSLPGTLGRNTAIFQSLSYLGFLAPLPIAILMHSFTLVQVLMGCLILAFITFVWLLPWRRFAGSSITVKRRERMSFGR